MVLAQSIIISGCILDACLDKVKTKLSDFEHQLLMAELD
jgi:hypothetical protein